jgi:succinate dehydrogenase / fumarate reductase membrane anchor subunit
VSLRSPLGRVLGLGSTRSGYHHWWNQRVSAVGLALLGPWFVLSMLGLAGADYGAVAAWAAQPWHAILLILLLLTLLLHSNLGLQVVMEDYVAHGANRVVALVLSRFVHVVLAVAGVYAIVMISLGARP